MISKHIKALKPFFGKVVIVEILGDAEAFCFDWDTLSNEKKQELIDYHFAAANKVMEEKKGKKYLDQFQPFALLGHSIPAIIANKLDFSAPHEGILFVHKEHGPVLYCASKDDPRLAILHENVEALSPKDSCMDKNYDANAIDFTEDIDRSECEGFTLGQIDIMMECAGGSTIFICGE